MPAISPLFALFGRYLAGRTDRLPLSDCRVLAGIPIAVEPTPMFAVGELLVRRLGGPLVDHFNAFNEPGRTTVLHQWHDAELHDGTAVTVKLVRPEARVLVDGELELLSVLEELNLEVGNVSTLVEDFVVWLDRQLDLGQEVIGLEQLAAEVGGFDAFEVPVVLPELCSRDVVIAHRSGGTPLDEVLNIGGGHRPRLARRLCQAWLQQSLLEGACPEGPLSENIRALSSERFAITGGLATTLDARWRRNLLDAVIATARNDPDRACDALLAECIEEDDAIDGDRVRSELRQAETFRSSGWTDDFTGRRIADSLFVYWRLLAGMGYRPKNHAIAFVRGFSELEAAARRMAPNTDVMAGAIEDFRLVAAAVKIRERLGPAALIRAAEELTPVIGEVLDHPDRWTRRLLNVDQDRKPDPSPPPPSVVSWQVFTGALAVLASATILGIATIRAHPEHGWLEWVVTLVFVAGAAGVFKLLGGAASR